MVASNKDRIYIALYARGGRDPDTYHWTLIVGPKKEVEGGRCIRFHVKQVVDPATPGHLSWTYETNNMPLNQTAMLLARVLIGKVLDRPRLTAVLERVPIVPGGPEWTCQTWVRDAVAALEADGRCLGTRVTDWNKLEQTSNGYVAHKRQQRRYDGSHPWVAGLVPTYSLLEDKELIL